MAPDDRYLSAGDLGRAATAAATDLPTPRAGTSVAVGSAQDPSVDVRQAPTRAAAVTSRLPYRSAALAAPVTARLPYRAPVMIVCTAIGDPVAEPPGTPNLTNSPVWDRVRAGSAVGFIPDVFVGTRTYKLVAPLC
jgi:hypothetical protein